jgi:outer membrane protein OmpA-like peptidoglycan-associated protein
MRKLLILLLALLAIAAIAYFCVYKTHVPAIQKDIAARAQAALTDNGISSIDVKVDGRDITLTGEAPSPQIKQAAERIAQVSGYNFIDNQINVAGSANDDDASKKNHSLSIKLNESGKVTLDGILDTNTHKALREATVKRYGEANVKDRILELDIPMADGMPDVAVLMMEKLSALTSGEAVLVDNEITIKGTSPSKVMISRVEQQLKEKTPKSYALKLDLEVAKGASEPSDAVAEKPASRAKTKQCQRQFNSILRSRKVRFNSSSSVLKKSSYKVLNKLAATAKKCPGMKIKIHGHTDSTGRNSLNKRLSKKRARAVAKYLARKGIKENKLVSVGHGSSKPIASNKTNKGRARNRRIELTVESIK